MTDPRSTNSGSDNLAGRLLRLVSADLDPSSTIQQILSQLLDYSALDRAVVIVLVEPQLIISSDEADIPDEWVSKLVELSNNFDPGLYISPDLAGMITSANREWLLGVMRGVDLRLALLWAEAHTTHLNVDVQKDDLVAVLDALTVAARAIHLRSARHRQTRNQVEFMRIVAHDLRSPLTAMRGFVNMIAEVGEVNQLQNYYVEKVDSGIQQMALMVDNFQDAGRYDPETGFYEMQRGPCDVTEIVQRIVGNYLVPAEKLELTVATRIADGIPIVNADQIMLERAVTNLVDNAIKYTPNGGRVEVGVDVSDQGIVISVKDNGYGIKPEDQANIFDRHVRVVRKEHRRVKGSGLGLFIVRSVAQHHAGNAWVVSEEGNGTTFFISLPLEGDNVLSAGSD